MNTSCAAVDAPRAANYATLAELADPSPSAVARRAVVIGSGIAGLLAARVLADHFHSVHLIERDTLPHEPVGRKGVPQARFVHQMLMRGRRALEQFFPDIERELIDNGAIPLDWYADVHWFGPAGWMARSERGFATWSTSRDLLEFVVRRRVRALAQVTLHEGYEALGLLREGAHGPAQGVRLRRVGEDGAAEHELAAALVVDASGRASHMPIWLQAIGYDAPRETVVNAFVGYASRIYRIPQEYADARWRALVVHSKPPLCARGGTIFPIEGDRWIVTLTGAAGDYPPADEAGFLEFARSLRSPMLYEAIAAAQPLSPVHYYRRMENRLRHYERLSRWPDGVAVIGDAVCGFNPVYGQGMTVAALDAQLLDAYLRSSGRRPVGLAFQREVAAARRTAWMLSTGVDYRYGKTEGPKRAWHARLAQRYMDHVVRLAAERGDVYRRLLHVMHMVSPPTTLLSLEVAARIAIDCIRNTKPLRFRRA